MKGRLSTKSTKACPSLACDEASARQRAMEMVKLAAARHELYVFDSSKMTFSHDEDSFKPSDMRHHVPPLLPGLPSYSWPPCAAVKERAPVTQSKLSQTLVFQWFQRVARTYIADSNRDMKRGWFHRRCEQSESGRRRRAEEPTRGVVLDCCGCSRTMWS